MAFCVGSPATGPWPSGTEDSQGGCLVLPAAGTQPHIVPPPLGAPGEEGAWLPSAVPTLRPDSSRELGRVNVHPHVTPWAGTGGWDGAASSSGPGWLLCCAEAHQDRQADGMSEVGKGTLTTHVLNTATGLPAAGLVIRLAQLQEPGLQWTELAHRHTDADGRCQPLLAPGQAKAGTYKLHFETAEYWQGLGHTSFYPFVEVVFVITDPARKLHVPLLISPYSYTTYRGS
ncbi:transthyretin-like [Onychostruthus taczanowskii]|uniref:transthyretin-like n=1 Tax=Onychostruthus taczanowskii TaxID=356909 RepID=UPI001B80E1F2|nr:transthyretin-like [Onychostruthus taczanowskii]